MSESDSDNIGAGKSFEDSDESEAENLSDGSDEDSGEEQIQKKKRKKSSKQKKKKKKRDIRNRISDAGRQKQREERRALKLKMREQMRKSGGGGDEHSLDDKERQRMREERRALKLKIREQMAKQGGNQEKERKEVKRLDNQEAERLDRKRAERLANEKKLEEEREERRKRKLKMKHKLQVKPKGGSANGTKEEPKSKVKSFKDATRMEKLDMAMKAFKWWESQPLEEGIMWRYLEHNGIVFPPEYQPHGVKLLCDGEPMDLNPDEEEVATFYATMPEDGPQLGNADTRKIFRKNFFQCFKKALRKEIANKLKKFDQLDFTLIREHLNHEKIIKKAQTELEKKKLKDEKQGIVLKHGFGIVDGHLERVGNTMMEPPGLFRGRGKHPKMGLVKNRVLPGQVTINIGEDARPPKCPLPGHAWFSVQHDPTVTWLATWNENIMGSNKYVQLAASSSFKGKSDRDKYNKAAMLKGYINKIREDYQYNLWKKNTNARQIATAMWIIDKLALRVGGEKGEDEADTVGCCSLRVEHLRFPYSEDEHKKYVLELEFLGKDSMLFKQSIDFGQHGRIGRRVYKNLVGFCKGKEAYQDVFETLQPSILNAHFSSLMPGLSAKVFRTYNASETLQNELPKESEMENLTLQEKVVQYNAANRKVAILCNHQRTVSNAAAAQFENLQERLDLLQIQRKELKQMYRLVKAKKFKKVPLQTDRGKRKQEKAMARIEAAKKMKAEAKTVDEKKQAMEYEEAARQSKIKAMKIKASESHLFAKMPTSIQVKKRVMAWAEKIKKLKLDIQDRDENKEVALGTSKINYMDPRISVAWCKRNEVPIEKIFSKTLRDKFNWACAVPPDWRFEAPGHKQESDGDDNESTAAAETSDVPIKFEEDEG
mmetsp:Transcript_34351/g.43371  ORF Transcript_34351/g.43371 Transcript_34351/m.43371 type:complete len:884 (+) Transcript_34351:47-2698(+)